MDESPFDGEFIESIGDLRALVGVSADEFSASLPAARFALLTATAPVPVDWPSELLRNAPAEFDLDGKRESHETNTWYFMEAGGDWRRFYAYSLTTYLQELKTIPAFVYERIANDACVSYLPAVSLLLSLDRRIRTASKSWCESVLADRRSEA